MNYEPLLDHTLLTLDEELALARRIQTGDQEALDELIHHNLRLVKKIVQRFYASDLAMTWDDLMQEGMLGLYRAAQKYDPDRGLKFSTYATYWIRQKVGRACLVGGTIRRSANPNLPQKTEKAIRAHALRQARIARLDAPLIGRKGDDNISTLADIIADDSTPVEDQALTTIEIERIIAALRLNERGQAVVRDWLSGVPRKEAQEMHGVSHSWICTILKAKKENVVMPHIPSSTTCSEPGCNLPRYINEGGQKFARCHEHQRQFWRIAAAARRNAEPQQIETVQPPPCTEPGCNLPRYTNTRGITFPRCEQHQRQFWAEASPANTPAPITAPLPSPARTRVKNQPAPVPHDELETDSSEHSSQDGCTCDDCIYREIVGLLADRYPRIAELAQVMLTARRLRDDLGIKQG